MRITTRVPNVTLAVAVTDDDTAAIVVEAAENFAVTEGSTATYTVRLATKPGSDRGHTAIRHRFGCDG